MANRFEISTAAGTNVYNFLTGDFRLVSGSYILPSGPEERFEDFSFNVISTEGLADTDIENAINTLEDIAHEINSYAADMFIDDTWLHRLEMNTKGESQRDYYIAAMRIAVLTNNTSNPDMDENTQPMIMLQITLNLSLPAEEQTSIIRIASTMDIHGDQYIMGTSPGAGESGTIGGRAPMRIDSMLIESDNGGISPGEVELNKIWIGIKRYRENLPSTDFVARWLSSYAGTYASSDMSVTTISSRSCHTCSYSTDPSHKIRSYFQLESIDNNNANNGNVHHFYGRYRIIANIKTNTSRICTFQVFGGHTRLAAPVLSASDIARFQAGPIITVETGNLFKQIDMGIFDIPGYPLKSAAANEPADSFTFFVASGLESGSAGTAASALFQLVLVPVDTEFYTDQAIVTEDAGSNNEDQSITFYDTALRQQIMVARYLHTITAEENFNLADAPSVRNWQHDHYGPALLVFTGDSDGVSTPLGWEGKITITSKKRYGTYR